MDYIQELQQKLKSQSQEGSIRRLIYEGFFSLEDKILLFQKRQITEHEGFDDKLLSHSNKTFDKGVYSPSTQNFADLNIPYPSLTSKTSGNPYNFVWGGDFMNNFRIQKKGKGINIYSTGTGSGEKQDFFEGYQNMFGLNSENTATIESEVEYYVLEKILTRVYG